MNTTTHTALFALFIAAAFFVVRSYLRRRQLVPLANVSEGVWPGCKAYYSSGAITARYLLGTAGADDRHIALCGVGDVPRGIITDEADAAEELVNVDLLGVRQETAKGVASGAISEADELVAGASGTVRALPVAAGTYWVIGRALSDAADAGIVQYVPSFPVQRVVS